MKIVAIDPGTFESAYAVFEPEERIIAEFGKVTNESLKKDLARIAGDAEITAIEMVASYGMPVGKTVFETVLFIGRLVERLDMMRKPYELVYRKDVKMHLCGTTRAKDSNIIQALIDKYAPYAGNHGKGNKANPGFFYGFSKDVWQAFALADYMARGKSENNKIKEGEIR